MLLPDGFFNRDAHDVACALLGTVIRHRVGHLWLAARIIETESYYVDPRYARHSTRNPLRRGQQEGRDYQIWAAPFPGTQKNPDFLQ